MRSSAGRKELDAKRKSYEYERDIAKLTELSTEEEREDQGKAVEVPTASATLAVTKCSPTGGVARTTVGGAVLRELNLVCSMDAA